MAVLSSPPKIAPVVKEQLAFIESGLKRTPAEIEAAFRAMIAVVDENITYAESKGAYAHDALVALERTRTGIYALRTRYFRGADRERRFIVKRRMAMWEVAKLVYGDASKVFILYQANQVPDPSAIAPGTVLNILPIE